MKQLNHIYFRILFALITLMTSSSVVMGQGQVQEGKIPVALTSNVNPIEGYSLSNLNDGNTSTEWKAEPTFNAYEYMQLKEPDNSADGKRSWVEIPYVPNNNTEIEITFQASAFDIEGNGITRHIFGCGVPRWGSGICFGINSGKYVFKTSNKSHEALATADQDKHTAVCSLNSFTIDSGSNLFPGTIEPSDLAAADDEIVSNGGSTSNLCLFCSPGDSQEWARNFNGKIYNVKIRENGKLLYDLIPSETWWGRPGFCDRLSGSFYGFFDMVEYVKNANPVDKDHETEFNKYSNDGLHVHYKIPYTMGSGTTTGYSWTDNLVTNGNLASDDFSVSFEDVNNAWIPRITSDAYGKAIQVINNGTHFGEGTYRWDCHLTAKLSEALTVGKTYTLSFWSKADSPADVSIDLQNESLDYYGEGGKYSFTNESANNGWVNRTKTITPAESDKGLIKAIGFNFNHNTSANHYYIAGIEVKENESGTDLVPSHANYTDLSNIIIVDDNKSAVSSWESKIGEIDGKKAVVVENNGNNGADSWNCQFRIKLSDTLNEGDKYNISFFVKAKNEADISGQLQQAGGGYYDNIPPIKEHVGTSWKRVVWTGTVGAHKGSVGAIGVMLNTSTAANTYYFSDIIVKKGSPQGTVPDTEVEIKYKNTRGGSDSYSSRYLFSYGTMEDAVMAMSIKDNEYKYMSGGVSGKLTMPNTEDEVITTIFRPLECESGGQIYGMTGGSGTPDYGSVSNFYLFGTHSTNGNDAARSFVGEIYGVIIRENGVVKVNLQPACKNGVFGFYDKVSKTFYTKEELDSNCGKSAQFDGITDYSEGATNHLHDRWPAKSHIRYTSTTGKKVPFVVTLDAGQSVIAKSFEVTTAADGDTNTNPKNWTLYASADGNSWTSLIDGVNKPECVMSEDGKKYDFNLGSNTPYSKYRFIVDDLVSGSVINLSEIALTARYKFEHYEGPAYDGNPDVPSYLRVGESGVYPSAWKTSADDARIGSGVKLQRTHEYEHEIYVLPGQTVDLTPFSDFLTTDRYEEMYLRWYDYKSDTKTDRLHFEVTNGKNVLTLDEGFFAWTDMVRGRPTREGAVAKYTALSDPGTDEVIDVIALEASIRFNGTNWENDDHYLLKEPDLQWRHVFVIKNAIKRADAMFESAAKNENYIAKTKIKLMCPEGTPFQYPLPSYEEKAVAATHPTNFYYHTEEGYQPVYHYSIETTKDGVRLGASNVNFTNVAEAGEGKEDQMAISYKDIDGFNRVFYIKNPQVGKYTIKLNAMNSNCTGGARDDRMGDTPLLLMEYELTVLPKEKASMVPYKVLYHKDSDGNYDYEYQKQLPSVMEKNYNGATTVVNFEDDIEDVEKYTVEKEGASGVRYSIWPRQWEDSSYGFGFNYPTDARGDYSMYMILNNSDALRFCSFASVEDIKSRDSGGEQKGYYYYCNAASDPSRMAVLDIGKNFCPYTRVYVSAWVNELQNGEPYSEAANVIFSFRGVDSNGNETLLNSYVSGYVQGGWNTPDGYDKDGFTTYYTADDYTDNRQSDWRGDWVHVYYEFTTTSEINFNAFDHYIITLENNATSSFGADYAIDDIRAYVLKPNLQARLMEPICDGDPGTKLEIFGNFEQLQEAAIFSDEADKNETLRYCFLDKEIFDETYTGSNVQDAFNASLVKNVYGTNTDYGTLTLNTTFGNNTAYEDKWYESTQEDDFYYKGYKQDVGNIIIFPCKVTDVKIKPGKTYLLAIANGSNAFEVAGKCSKTSDLKIPNPADIKIDGKLQTAEGGSSVCANQRPEVAIDMNGVRVGGAPVTSDVLKFDWYYGPLGQPMTDGDPSTALTTDLKNQGYTRAYMGEKKGDMQLNEVMLKFRDYNPTATDDDVLLVTEDNNNGLVVEGQFTKPMLLYIKELVQEGRITLYKDKAFAAAHLYGENLDPDKQEYVYITALPVNPSTKLLEDNPDIRDVKFCLNPVGVRIKISEFTPKMKDGDSKVTYPETLHDVPLRIGLKQLKRTVISDIMSTSVNPEHLLWLPLRAIAPVNEDGKEAGTTLIKDANELIYLVDSNDPIADTESSGAIVEADPEDAKLDITSKLVVVGKVMDIGAVKNNPDNVCKLAFLKSFKFREGYWYTMKLHFKQKDASEKVCPGDLIFTIKVVPEYQMWTGAVSRNWNDDRNWKRVTSGDLLWPDSYLEEKDANDNLVNVDYVTNGTITKNGNTTYVNDNTASYAPADFTKVIMPAGLQNVPFMYNLHENKNTTSIQFAGAPAATDQLTTALPADDIFSEIGNPDAYADEKHVPVFDLNGKTVVITDATGKKTLGVTHDESHENGVGDQDALVVTNDTYSDDMYVYAKFNKVEKAGVEGNTYTIQLHKADGTNFSLWGSNGYLNFNPSRDVVFALGLGDDAQYGHDAENYALWDVNVIDGDVIIKNVGKGRYLNPLEAKPSNVPVACKLVMSFGSEGAGMAITEGSHVQYDMASVDRSDDDVACRSWYDHTCDQIHFNSGAILMDQRYLYYNKAWCDIEVPVGTWQTVASPLVNIVAGDLYLPTDGARQNTPLFEDITYQTSSLNDPFAPAVNDRFAPAVYQHSWNKSMATVYELGGGSRNVGIKLDWSHVYNDVNVKYGAGQGFSIKVDVSSDRVTNKPTVAKFRFPKADKQYTYYNPGNADGDKKTETVVDGSSSDVRPGRLADLTSTAFQEVVGDNSNDATATSYFLVGNPLICWLDMNKFFAENPQFEPKYWIATANGQQTALFTEEGFVSTTNDDPQYLAPGVSFFVHLNQQLAGTTTEGASSTTVTPKFTADMMSYTQGETQRRDEVNPDNGARTRASVAQNAIPQLHVTAEDANGRRSVAVMTDGTVVKHDMVETLFDSNLEDDMFIYTTKHGQAQSIVNIAPGDTLPLITAGRVDDVVLRIEGAADFECPLYVIDSEEGTMEPLTDDVTLKCKSGDVRYYIASSVEHQNNDLQANLPRVTAQHGRITVYAPAGEVISSSQIFTTNGQCVDRASNITTSHTATLLQGIYIVKLQVNGTSYTYKLLLTSK